jgi:hypothetical protein
MQTTILAVFFEFSSTAFSMSAAGLALLVIGLLAAKNDIIQARGIDKVVLGSGVKTRFFRAEEASTWLPWRVSFRRSLLSSVKV